MIFLSYDKGESKDMKKKNMIIIGVIALILVITIGYALFSDTLNINGTATAKGDFSLSYKCKVVDGSSNQELDSCEVQGNKVLTSSTLLKPTDQVQFLVTVTNTGSIPAELKNITSPNNADSSNPTLPGDGMYVDSSTGLIATFDACHNKQSGGRDCYSPSGSNLVIQPQENLEIQIIHGWVDSDMIGLQSQPELPEEGATMNYNLTLDFEQATN